MTAIVSTQNYADFKATVKNTVFLSWTIFYYSAGNPGQGTGVFYIYAIGAMFVGGSNGAALAGPLVFVTPNLTSQPSTFTTDFAGATALTAQISFPTSA